MKKSSAILSVVLAVAAAFSAASCGRAKKLKAVPAEQREAVLNEYREKYLASLSDVLYLKDYQRVAISAGSGDEAYSFASSSDADYAFAKSESETTPVLSAFARETDVLVKAPSGEQESGSLSLYLNEKGTYTLTKENGESSKSFYPIGSFVDDPLRKTALSDVFLLCTEILRSVGEADGEGTEILAYSEASGSGFKTSFTLDATSDEASAFEGADTFFEIFGDGAEVKMTLSLSLFFNASGGLDYAETEMKLSLSSDGETSEKAPAGEYRYYRKTTVQSASTVKYPVDLDGYQAG